MTSIHQLRTHIDQQQFFTLKIEVEDYLIQTGNIQALPLKALAFAHLGERVEAEKALVKAESHLARLNDDALADIAGVYCLMFRIEEAKDVLETIVDKHPDKALALARLAWCRMQNGELESAIALYQKSVELIPNRLPVWSALSLLYLQVKDIAAAQTSLDTGVACLNERSDQLPEDAVTRFTEQFRCVQLELWVTDNNIAQAEQWLEKYQELLDEDQWTGLIVQFVNVLSGTGDHAIAEETLISALKTYPKNEILIHQLYELANMQGRTGQVIKLLKRLIALANENDKPEVRYWVQLSTAFLHQSIEPARHAAEKAVELVEAMEETDDTSLNMIKSLSMQAKNALAQVESQEQNFDLAETLFNEILEENPYFIGALQGLGQQQMQRGNIDEAVALFERIKVIDPAKGYSSLINARNFPDDTDVLERMEKVARKPSIEGAVNGSLLLQIATAWEKRKDYNKAFALAVEANDATKQHINYNPKIHRQEAARIRHAFCKALYDNRPDCGVDSSLPIYVLGMPRSGTTLIEQILAGHSKICGAGELGVIPSRIQGLNRWERHTGSGRRYPDCVDDLTPYVVEGIAKGILEELQEYDEQALHIIDKLPHNFENIGLIKFFFPNAKIISVRRDPRDIALSNYFTDYQAKQGGMGFAYDLEWVGEQLADHNMMMHHWQTLFPDEILEINYEDVVNDTEGSARKMLDYIGVDWEPQVLKFNELDRSVKTASVWQVRQPIYKTSQEKWKRYQNHLAPLIKGTNKRIEFEYIDMLTLPEAGFLTTGVEHYRKGELYDAEMSFKKMLHHNPDHAACNYMVGLVYLSKNHMKEGIEQVKKALDKAPWQKEWQEILKKAMEEAKVDNIDKILSAYLLQAEGEVK